MSDLSRMWLRLRGSGSSAEEPSTSSVTGNGNATVNPSTFDKFRRASFRRKQSMLSPSSKKRSNSPRFQQSTSLDELDEATENSLQTATGSAVQNGQTIQLDLRSSTIKNENSNSSVPLSDSKTSNTMKKTSLKSLKALKQVDAGKGKFCTTTPSSYQPPKNNVLEMKQNASMNRTFKPNTEKIFPADSNLISISALSEDDEDDEDSDEDDDHKPDARRIADPNDELKSKHNDFQIDVRLTIADNLPYNGKEKILLTDRKFRNNRIEKSSSKSKIGDLDKKESIRRSRSNRKIYQNPALADEAKNSLRSKDSQEVKKKTSRTHPTLNLQALVKFVVNNRKCLNSDEFNLIRRKSISDAAAAVIQVAATCKPLPIALKYTQECVATSPKQNDKKCDRNVVLVKKQPLNTSFYDRLLNNNSNQILKTPTTDKKTLSSPTTNSIAKVKRNSSNSSKSSGNFEDEAFYSCDEAEEQRLREEEESLRQQKPHVHNNSLINPKRKISSSTPPLSK